MKRVVAVTTCSATAMLGALSLGASPANASAVGCSYNPGFGFTFKGFSLRAPKGYLCHYIRGRGKWIDAQRAAYAADPSIYGGLTGKVCNWRIDFTYHRAGSGRLYRYDRGPMHYRCNHLVRRFVERDKVLRYYGQACARLVVNGVQRSRQCHNIIR